MYVVYVWVFELEGENDVGHIVTYGVGLEWYLCVLPVEADQSFSFS